MKILATADIGGAITNRVRMRKAPRERTPRVRRKAASAGTALRRYRKDPETRGLDYAQVCISMPVAELAVLDAVAERVQMARSHFIRQAVRHFAAKVTP